MPDRIADLMAWGLSESVARRVASQGRPLGPVRDPRSEAERYAALLAEQDRLDRQTATERASALVDPTLIRSRMGPAPAPMATLASIGPAPERTLGRRIDESVAALTDNPAQYDTRAGVTARGDLEPLFGLGMDALSATGAGITRGLRTAGLLSEPQLDAHEEALKMKALREVSPHILISLSHKEFISQ